MRVYQQPQFRRTTGPRRAHASVESDDGRGGGNRRPFHRYSKLEVPIMQPFRKHKGKVAPLYRANIDTDQIITKQFLKKIEKTGFGQFLFNDWRRAANGTPDPSFVLNQPKYSGASILVAAKNFGCGSSRE